MSSPIAPTPTPADAQPTCGIAAVAHGNSSSSASAAQASAASAPSIAFDALPSSPPQEVLEQMASAAQTYEQLSAQGRELRFAHDAASGRTQIEVRDRNGNLLKALSPAQALDLAAGAPLE